MSWITACKLEDIEQEGAMRFDHGSRTYAIYRGPDDSVYCTAGLCTHEAIHLAEGLVMDFEVECPKHSGAFDYRTGEALTCRCTRAGSTPMKRSAPCRAPTAAWRGG